MRNLRKFESFEIIEDPVYKHSRPIKDVFPDIKDYLMDIHDLGYVDMKIHSQIVSIPGIESSIKDEITIQFTYGEGPYLHQFSGGPDQWSGYKMDWSDRDEKQSSHIGNEIHCLSELSQEISVFVKRVSEIGWKCREFKGKIGDERSSDRNRSTITLKITKLQSENREV